MSRARERPGPVVVVAPTDTPSPNDIGDLTRAVLADPRRIAVTVRPGQRRPRTADLVADTLDALGRPGTSTAIRAHLDSNLTLLVPFLLTDDVTDLVVFEPAWLGRDSCEDLIAVAVLAHVRLWLVLATPPPGDLTDLLAGHCPAWWAPGRAVAHWTTPHPPPTRRTRRGAAVATLRHTLSTHEVSSDHARTTLAAAADTADPASRTRLIAAHGRDTVRPAARALACVPGLDRARLGTLPVRALAPDARHIAAGASTTRVPPGVRRVLLRQRLHALVIGQRPGDPLLSIDGSPFSTLGIATLTGPASSPT